MAKNCKFLPPPPSRAAVRRARERVDGEIDGRSTRATGRRMQFNPRVHENFIAGFKTAVAEEEARLGVPVQQGYLLERMLAAWRQITAARTRPGGGVTVVLSERAALGAEDLAAELGVSIDEAVEQAICAGQEIARAVPRRRRQDLTAAERGRSAGVEQIEHDRTPIRRG